MKVFLSWSGDRSKAVAEHLSEWLQCVLQSCRPWISSRDIDRGALWFAEITGHLQDTSVGVVVLTQENKDRPWILFEAGALAKGLSSSRVCTLLVDLDPKDIQDPLAQFNHTSPTEDGMRKLVISLNSAMEPGRLEPTVLNRVFDTYWPQFLDGFKRVLDTTKPAKPPAPRKSDDMLVEILESTRSLNARLRELELREQTASRDKYGSLAQLRTFREDSIQPKSVRQRLAEASSQLTPMEAAIRASGLSAEAQATLLKALKERVEDNLQS